MYISIYLSMYLYLSIYLSISLSIHIDVSIWVSGAGDAGVLGASVLTPSLRCWYVPVGPLTFQSFRLDAIPP